ncbi:MAG: protease modulator HflC [Gammaproteobacteria bacterium]|nr:protease modulator HflC [Gammaproteobacteria bacterium]
MEARNMFLGIFAILVLWIGSMSIFVVNEKELAIKFQLGEFVRADYTPGIYFKLPFVNNVRKFERRIITLDAPPVPYLTLEKKNLIVDSYIKWRIVDVEAYYRSMRGQESKASERLSKIVQEGLRNEFAKRTIQEAISGERAEIMQMMSTNISKQVSEFGIEVIDVRIKRIDLPVEVSESVFKRMRAERERVAKDLRSRGKEEAERIKADADKQGTVLLAEANRESEQTRGAGDAKAAEIYAKAYGKNEEFYDLYRSLGAYQNVFSQSEDLMVIDAQSEFFKYFKDSAGRK